ncbi:MAG: HAD family hydrolase [Treponema sp.]|jgi:putative hydrolase of the HAD superfamily|nr:HAD family hydrolase [Treponema sp.]
MRSGIEAVAFDLDGTLYPNYRLYIRLAPFILSDWPLLLAFGKARTIIRAEQAPAQGRPPSILPSDFYAYQAALIARMLKVPPELIREKTERLIYRGWESHFTKIRLFPHVAETLAAFRQAGLKLGMLSDFPPETKLTCLGIGDYWDTALCSERFGALKPDRRPFEALAAALNLPPERILYVGNSRRYDVTGAKRAGMRAALVTGLLSGAGKGEYTNVPDFMFHDYRQLRTYVVN